MKKWLLALFLIICLPFQTKAASIFSDVPPGTEVGDAVTNLVERGIISGYKDGTFRPNVAVTRAQAAKILAGVLKLDTKNASASFSDVPETYEHYGAIAALAERKILNGYADGTFKPNSPITRGQMAKIITNAFRFSGVFQTLPFSDIAKGSETFGHVNALYSYAITTGTTATTFSPGSSVTRGHLAVFITRAENSPREGTLITAGNMGMTSIADWSIENESIKIVSSGTELHLLPVKAGSTRLLIAGPPSLSAQQMHYKLFKAAVQNKNGTLQISMAESSLIEGLTHNVNYYTYDSLQLGFIPTTLTVQGIDGKTLGAGGYYIGRTSSGLELSIYTPGHYIITAAGNGAGKTFSAVVTVKNFETILDLYPM
jgi:hypothetical protein